jgi:xanthine dehydrogenase accessory factor
VTAPLPFDAGSDAALRAAAAAWRAAGRAAAVVCVERTAGSVPREAGTRMLVPAEGSAPDAQPLGTIGGGQLEWQALADARAWLSTALPGTSLAQRVPLGPTLGQCCGGVVWLRTTRLQDDDPAAWPTPAPRFALQLHGAGHVGRALVRVLAPLPCTVQWVDGREHGFPPSLPPSIQPLASDDAAAEVALAPPGALLLVMTHSHALDLEIVAAALRRPDLPWIGLIGSASKRVRFQSRLEARGWPDAALARLHCPIGLPGIGGKAPEVIAVAVAAQLLQLAGAPAAAAAGATVLTPEVAETEGEPVPRHSAW